MIIDVKVPQLSESVARRRLFLAQGGRRGRYQRDENLIDEKPTRSSPSCRRRRRTCWSKSSEERRHGRRRASDRTYRYRGRITVLAPAEKPKAAAPRQAGGGARGKTGAGVAMPAGRRYYRMPGVAGADVAGSRSVVTASWRSRCAGGLRKP